jgi:hypothetical protein
MHQTHAACHLQRKRRRKGSSKRSSKDKKRKRSSKDKKKGKDKKERKEKRAKDEGRAKLTASEDFGKFGIIREVGANRMWCCVHFSWAASQAQSCTNRHVTSVAACVGFCTCFISTAPCLPCACTQTDAGAKRPEFILWAIDVKGVDVESLSRPDERELFKDFMEDYNTGEGRGGGGAARYRQLVRLACHACLGVRRKRSCYSGSNGIAQHGVLLYSNTP